MKVQVFAGNFTLATRDKKLLSVILKIQKL